MANREIEKKIGTAVNDAPADLTVRFLEGPPQEEAIHFARRCFAEAAPGQVVTLVIQWNRDHRSVREVRAILPNGSEIVEHEPDVLIAIRNACARANVALVAARSGPVHSLPLHHVVCLGLALGIGGCSGARQAPPPESNAPKASAELAASTAPPDALAPLVDIPNAARALPGVLTGGQPTPEQLEAAARLGYRSVISLRPEGEAGSAGERERVSALGMRFVAIPVAGAADLTEANARALSAALAGDAAKPAIVHCGTGNRAGALLALEAFYVRGKPAGEALELGRRAGLKGLEGAVRAQLESAPARTGS